MEEHLRTPWFQVAGDTYEIPTIPGQFPIEVQELLTAEAVEIHELPDAASNEFRTGLENLSSPFDWQIPDAAFIDPRENLNDSPLQQQGNSDRTADSETPHHSTSKLDPLNPSNLGPTKATKSSTKDSSKSKPRKGQKTSATIPSNDIVIAVFGLTGTGKSSFISKLTGKDVKIGHNLQSCEHFMV
jgi:hypothetical protein